MIGNKGFTLIEIMVAISMFAIIVGAFLGLFSSAFLEQKNSLDMAYLLNNGSYLMDYMGRSIRMAQREDLTGCLSSSGLNYEITRTGSGIKFINYEGVCHEFFVEDGIFKIERGGVIEDLTPQNIEVQDINFYVTGENSFDTSQPKVTVSFLLKTVTEPYKSINIQTTISKRELDF